MGAPLKLSSDQLIKLASALTELTRITEDTGVDFTGYGHMDVLVGNNYIKVRLIDGEYVVDDYIGD